MKLRNKKTGELANAMFYAPIGEYEITIWKDIDYLNPSRGDHSLGTYKTLAALNEEWEDYTPAEPLIKDEKIRKAVRAWAEAWGKIFEREGKAFRLRLFHLSSYTELNCMGLALSIPLNETLKEGEYTLAELCGEEEE